VFVQYSGYGFQRFGYPRWLIKRIGRLERESQGFLAIMFHEIWTFWPVWNKNYPIQQLHRRDIGRLLRVTDKTSPARQARRRTSELFHRAARSKSYPSVRTFIARAWWMARENPALRFSFGLQFREFAHCGKWKRS
jgi:hypothetical protein